jgi:hypothetical protein
MVLFSRAALFFVMERGCSWQLWLATSEMFNFDDISEMSDFAQ